MSILFKSGNLFKEPDLDGLAHGVNCQGIMGAGIAVEFKRRYPAMFGEYKNLCETGRLVQGDCFIWTDPTKPSIFNLATQDGFGDATLAAITSSVNKMLDWAEEHNIKRIGLPAIGAGLGGLAWKDVKAVLTLCGESTPVELVCFETYIP